MSLSPEQRDDLQRLLEDELLAAWRAAAADGARPAEFASAVEERRRALASGEVSADPPGDGDDPVQG